MIAGSILLFLGKILLFMIAIIILGQIKEKISEKEFFFVALILFIAVVLFNIDR